MKFDWIVNGHGRVALMVTATEPPGQSYQQTLKEPDSLARFQWQALAWADEAMSTRFKAMMIARMVVGL